MADLSMCPGTAYILTYKFPANIAKLVSLPYAILCAQSVHHLAVDARSECQGTSFVLVLQIGQVMLALPHAVALAGMRTAVVLIPFYTLFSMWTIHLLDALYVEYKARKACSLPSLESAEDLTTQNDPPLSQCRKTVLPFWEALSERQVCKGTKAHSLYLTLTRADC